jgi:hypothetical protein
MKAGKEELSSTALTAVVVLSPREHYEQAGRAPDDGPLTAQPRQREGRESERGDQPAPQV